MGDAPGDDDPELRFELTSFGLGAAGKRPKPAKFSLPLTLAVK